MHRSLLVGLALFLLPVSVLAAGTSSASVFTIGRSVVLASTTGGNAYAAGGTVAVTASIPADLLAVGGSLLVTAPIGGDALLAGGNMDLRAPVAGDARLFGGRVAVSDIVTNGELPRVVQASMEAWGACVAGALTMMDFAAGLEAAGFVDVKIEPKGKFETGLAWLPVNVPFSAIITARKP